MSKSIEDLEKKYRPIVAEGPCFTLHSIQDINHKPHPYMIGARHVAYASKHCGGILGEEVLDKLPCAHPGCGQYYSKHTYDRVMFLNIAKSSKTSEVRVELQRIIDAGMDADGLAGFLFIKSEEGLEFINDEKEVKENGH